MNWVLMLVRNNMAITREAVESVLAQSVPVRLLIINNGSVDGASQYVNSLLGHDERIVVMHFAPGKGVAESWNIGLRYIWDRGAGHALVVNNDVILRHDCYELLLADGGEFVTAVGVRGRHYGERKGGLRVFKDNHGVEVFPGGVNVKGRRFNPDYSAYLMRKQTWELVGEFDENFRGSFCEDWDHHVRAHKAGIDAACIDLPFYHHGSATIKNSMERDARIITDQAGANREYFKSKWGVDGGTPQYYELFQRGATGQSENVISHDT